MKNQNQWVSGELNGYEFQAKVYEVGSAFGIKGGKISKLQIKKDDVVVLNYDRGWDVRPSFDFLNVYAEILKRYN